MKGIFTVIILLGSIIMTKANSDLRGYSLLQGHKNFVLNGLFTHHIADSFTAILQENNNVILDWTAAENLNIQKFSIEKSSDNINFKTVGSLTPKQSTESHKHYTVIDFNFETEGNLYYRIKWTDAKGAFKYSQVVIVSLSHNS